MNFNKVVSQVALMAIASQAEARVWTHKEPHEWKTVKMADFQSGTFPNKLDHFEGSTDVTYEQRFWTNDLHFDKETGPVFLYLCGEWTCSPLDDQTFQFQVGAEHNAMFITLEHRYYGASQPFEDWSTDNLRYLSSEQGLADIHFFIQEWNKIFEEEIGRQPDWITVGGSYPGALSAWFKSQYPNDSIGAWSSSGVIAPILDFYQNDVDTYLAAAKSSDTCPKLIQEQQDWVEDQWFNQGSKGYNLVLSIFGINASDIVDGDLSFFYYLADHYVGAIQYGKRTVLCNLIDGNSGKNMQAQVQAIADYGKNSLGTEYSGYGVQYMQDTKIDVNNSMRQWTWQYCNEFGFFQTPNAFYRQRATVLTLDYWTDFCNKVFGIEIETQTNATNKHYGGRKLTGENIFFANASEDPWQYAGYVQAPLRTKDQVNFRTGYMDCDDCGHCQDLSSPKIGQQADITRVQNYIAETVSEWLDQADGRRAAKEAAATEEFIQ